MRAGLFWFAPDKRVILDTYFIYPIGDGQTDKTVEIDISGVVRAVYWDLVEVFHQKIEAGQTFPRLQTLFAIGAALDIKPQRLLGRAETPQKSNDVSTFF
jgi:hypothetical protein